MKNQFTRRQFLATAGAAASVTLLSEPLFDGASALAAVPLVRRDVGRMDVQDLSVSTDRVQLIRPASFCSLAGSIEDLQTFYRHPLFPPSRLLLHLF